MRSSPRSRTAGAESIENLSRAIRAAKPGAELAALADAYLSDRNVEAPERGVSIAAAGSEVPRQSAEVRRATTLRIKELIGLVERLSVIALGSDHALSRPAASDFIHSFAGNAVDKCLSSERNALSASEFWFLAQAMSDLRSHRHAAVTLDTSAIRKPWE